MVSVHVFPINWETSQQNVVKLKRQSSGLMKKNPCLCSFQLLQNST